MEKMENHGGSPMQGKTCNCPHHKVIPWLVILVGLDFLLGALNILSGWFVDVTWPIFVIIAGGTMLNQGSCKCC